LETSGSKRAKRKRGDNDGKKTSGSSRQILRHLHEMQQRIQAEEEDEAQLGQETQRHMLCVRKIKTPQIDIQPTWI